MADKFQLDTKEMRKELKNLASGIEQFRPFAEKGFDNEIELLSEMNSDFTPSLKKVLRTIARKNIKAIFEDIEKYHASGKKLVTVFDEKVDKAMAGKMGGKK